MLQRASHFAIAIAAASHLGCGDATTDEPGTDPESSELSSESAFGEGFHLGKPFQLVNGVISAASNEYGLQASLYLNRDPDESDVLVTSTTGKICMHGTLTPAVVGDSDSYWGFNLGFTAGRDVELRAPARVTAAAPDAFDDPVVAWDFGAGRVLGFAATISGPVLPDPGLGFGAGAGGSWVTHGATLELTLYSDCAPPVVTSAGQVVESLFADLQNWWCIPGMMAPWTASTIDGFFWGLGSQLVDDAATAARVGPAPYDFCVSDIRPILAGAPPSP